MPKDEIDHDDSSNNDNIISHVESVWKCSKGRFQFLQVKCLKVLQNVKVAFLKKLFDIEQYLERNLKKKEWNENYERRLNQLEKEKLLFKHEIRRKDNAINILVGNFSNSIPKYSNYITSKNTEVSTQTNQQTKNIIQTSTASKNHRTIIASLKENCKNHMKLNINQLNNKTCGKSDANKNDSNNNGDREPLY